MTTAKYVNPAGIKPGTPGNHENMDAIFYDCIAGQAPGPIMDRYGPYQYTTSQSNRLIVFGTDETREAQEASAVYAIGAIGGVAVRAAAGLSDAAAALKQFAENGTAGASLQSSTMHDALERVSSGNGQLAALFIAANCVDDRARPRLSKVQIPAGQLSGFTENGGLTYHDSKPVLAASHRALNGYAASRLEIPSDNPGKVLAHIYADMLRRVYNESPEAAPIAAKGWRRNLIETCQTLRNKGVVLEEALQPFALQQYEQAQRHPETAQPVEPKIGMVDITRLPVLHRPDQNAVEATNNKAEKVDPLQSRHEWDDIVIKHLAAYAQCAEQSKQVRSGLGELLRRHPYLTRLNMQEAERVNAECAALIRNPKHVENLLLGQSALSSAEWGAAVAVAETYGMQVPDEVRQAGLNYLEENHQLLTTTSLLDLPPEELAAHGLTRDIIKDYVQIKRLEGEPLALVLLAAQVVTDNPHSVLPRRKQPPIPKQTHEIRLNRQLDKQLDERDRLRDAYHDWVRHTQDIDRIVGNLRNYLEKRYRTTIPDISGFGKQLIIPQAHRKLRLLALCAQGEAQHILGAPREVQEAFARRAHSVFSTVRPEEVPPAARPMYDFCMRQASKNAQPASFSLLPDFGRFIRRPRHG